MYFLLTNMNFFHKIIKNSTKFEIQSASAFVYSYNMNSVRYFRSFNNWNTEMKKPVFCSPALPFYMNKPTAVIDWAVCFANFVGYDRRSSIILYPRHMFRPQELVNTGADH